MGSNSDVLVFDLVGKFAHFRKFYTNSSSLSYLFPPRTAMEGMIAGMLGYDRDSYYKVFSPSRCSIAVSTRTRVRSIMQTVNYLYVKGIGDLNGKSGRTQIPVELILPEVFEENLRYRIYFTHDEDELVSKLETKLKENHSYYPTSLGSAQFLCKALFVSRVAGNLVRSGNETDLRIQTPLLASENSIKSLLGGKNGNIKLVTDIFPFHFEEGRIPGVNQRLIYDRNLQPLTVSNLEAPVTQLSYTDGGMSIDENIVFLETMSGN